MSAGRVLLAGVAAGAVNLVLGFGYAHFSGMVETFQAILREHGLRVIGEPRDAVPHLLVRLLIGIAVTALFAAVAPRFGAGPKGALVAAGFAWAFLYAYHAWGHVHIELFPVPLALAFAAWGAVEMALTVLAGAWIAVGRGFWSS